MYVYIYLCISSTIILKRVHDIQTAVFHFACGDTQTSCSMALWFVGLVTYRPLECLSPSKIQSFLNLPVVRDMTPCSLVCGDLCFGRIACPLFPRYYTGQKRQQTSPRGSWPYTNLNGVISPPTLLWGTQITYCGNLSMTTLLPISFVEFFQRSLNVTCLHAVNLLTPNDPYMCRIAPLTSKRYTLYIYSTNIGTEYFKHALYSPFFFLFKMQFVS